MYIARKGPVQVARGAMFASMERVTLEFIIEEKLKLFVLRQNINVMVMFIDNLYCGFEDIVMKAEESVHSSAFIIVNDITKKNTIHITTSSTNNGEREDFIWNFRGLVHLLSGNRMKKAGQHDL